MKRFALMIVTTLALVLVVALAHYQGKPATVVDIAVGSEDFTTLVAAVQAAGLVEVLSGEGPFTVFAPTNDAFAAALEALGITAEQLLADTETLTAILTYHVVPGKVMAADVIAAVLAAEGGVFMAPTVNGAEIEVTMQDGNVLLNGVATVITADLEAGNGVVHVIDAVILPPTE